MMQATNTPQHYPVVSQVEDFVSLVKCPICTKVLQNPIELRCSHIFCAHCIERFASGRNYTCPVCSKNVVKQSARPAHETDGAVTFVQNILKQLQAASIQQQATEEKLNPQIGDKQEKTSPKKLRVKPKVAATQNRNASASNAKSKVKPPEVKQKKLSPKNKKDTTHSPEKGKTKSDHKGTATTEAAHPPIVEPYKEHVLRWLHNSQNIFQRTSQTQQNASASPGSSKVAHLPKNLQSVSQRASKRRSLPPRQAVEQNYGRNYRSLDSLTNISTCRTNKSNLIKSKMLRIEKTKVDTKIFDSPVNDTELEESRIEDIDSNPLISKSGICKEIEEQCLQNIEQNLECKKSTRKRKQEEKKSDKVGASQQKPDWMRINKFAKMADKIDGVPKKLKVVTTKNDARKLNTSGALKVDIKRKINESIPDKSQNKSVDNDTNIEKIDKEKNVEKSDANLENNEVNEEKLEAKREKIAEHDKNNKTKERMDLSENVIPDSQFSTTMPSQQVYPSQANEPNQNMKSLRGKLNSNVRTILMENIMKEFEYSKWPTSSSQGTNTLVIDCTEKFRNKTTSPKNRERTTSMAPMNQPQQNGDNAEEDMFIANTQKLNDDADAFMEATQQMPEISNVTLHNKCEQFLMQYSELTQRLTCFFRMDTCHDGDESYEKLSLIHRHLQVLQPKFSNMSLILSNNDTNLQEQDIATHQYTQTDAIDELKVDVSVQTSPSKSSQKKKTQSPVMCNEHTQTSQRVICLEKSPIVYTDNIPNVADVQQSKQNSQKCDEDIAMKNTLDFVDFDTEMVMKNINLEKSHLHSQRKRETFTMALNTEQMALTEFISKTQLLDEPVSEKSQLHVKDKSQVSSNGSSNKQGSVRTTNEKKTRRKLYDSPNPPTSPKSPKSPRYPKSPKSDVSIPIAKGGQNKRVKPLAISDSEEDEQNAICKDLRRDDISVCFDSESQREFFNSPNADKYLDEVWNRLEIDTSTKTKTALTHDVDAQALQAEIKKNTREIIEKCAEMISNAGQIDASHKHKQSSGRTPIASQKKVKASQKTKTVPNHDLKSVESVCDLLTDSIFNDDDLFENYKTPSPCSSSRDKPRSTLHNVHSDLIYKDSTTSILTNILDEQPAEPNPPDVPPITILQDIQVVKTNVRKKSESEDDLIFSTPEGTPTKMPHKQTIYEDEVLVPPADFQDPPPPKSAKENKSPLMKLSSSTPRASQRRSQIWNVNQNILALSPINRTPSRVRFNMPTAASQNSALRTNKSPAGSAHLRRVTSTPSTNSTNLKSTPPPFRHNHNPPLFTHVNVVRKGPILSQQRPQPLNIQCGVGDVCDEDDLFVPRSSKPQAVIACSRLGKTEMIAINALAKRGLVRYSTAYDESVTHMVVAATDSNCAKDHTIKYVRAVAAGIWVVNFNWVQDSLAQNKLLSEEFYEVYDVTGSDGPKQSRLYRTTKPLFAGFKVYVAPPFQLITPAEIENIIRSLGGVTVTSPEALLPKDGYICLIISETGPTQDDDLYTNYQEWVDKLRVAPVEFEWLTRCIGAYKLNSLRRFALCTDESLCELGYPQNLLENVTCSFTQNE